MPDDLSSVDAAPLLCAGLDSKRTGRTSPAEERETWPRCSGLAGWAISACTRAPHGISRWSRIDRGNDRAELSKKLENHHYVDSSVTDHR